jgi:hypothetical protein
LRPDCCVKRRTIASAPAASPVKGTHPAIKRRTSIDPTKRRNNMKELIESPMTSTQDPAD